MTGCEATEYANTESHCISCATKITNCVACKLYGTTVKCTACDSGVADKYIGFNSESCVSSCTGGYISADATRCVVDCYEGNNLHNFCIYSLLLLDDSSAYISGAACV